MKIILIHGYGVDLETPFSIDNSKHAGFGGFEELIEEGSAIPYRWGVPVKMDYVTALYPPSHIKLYTIEKSLLYQDPRIIINLYKLILKEKPTHIITHSLGALALLLYLNHFDLPKSVQKIVTIQADIPQNISLPNEVIQALKEKRLRWENYYCWWDQALLGSSIYNLQTRAGLFGIQKKYIKNIFLPLMGTKNLHIASINNSAYVKRFLAVNSTDSVKPERESKIK